MPETPGALSEVARGRLLNVPAAGVSDALMHLGQNPRVVGQEIRPVLPYTKMAGRAFTLTFDFEPAPFADGEVVGTGILPALKQFEAEQRGPGWILVIAPAARDRGQVGEGMAMYCRSLGIGGILTDGAARDSHEVLGRNFPIFSRGLTPLGPYNALRLAEVDVPVTVGGVEINPGDVVVGDNDGVVAFDPSQVDDVIRLGAEGYLSGAAVQARIGSGLDDIGLH